MHRLVLVCIAMLSWPSVAPGQGPRGVFDGSIDLGGALLRQPGVADAGVVTAAGQYRYATSLSDFMMSGIGARTPDDRYTGQGILSASRLAPVERRWRWEVSASGSAFGLSNAGPAFGWQALAREHHSFPLGGAFAGIGLGELVQNGVWSRLLTGHIGGFAGLGSSGRDELSAAVAVTRFGTVASRDGGFSYSDGISYWTHYADRFDLVVGAGVRLTSAASLTTATWGSASVALWVSDHAALVLAGGRALEDVARGIPSVRYLSAAIRVGSRSPEARLATLVRRPKPVDQIDRMEVRVTGDSMREVAVWSVAKSTVELLADFTGWEPVPLSHSPNGAWTIECAIAPGTHRIAIRVDGGNWIVPPNLPRVQDDFGGEVGLLIVP